MKSELFENTRMLAYLLWEQTKSENALGLWYCAEDLANFFDMNGITNFTNLNALLEKERFDPAYINFVRNIAYRLYLYTGNANQKRNWFLAENILNNQECCLYIISAASIYNNIQDEKDIVKSIRSELVRNYYKNLNELD